MCNLCINSVTHLSAWTTVMKMFLAIVLFQFAHVDCQQIHSIAGPFRLVPDHIEHCPESVFLKELSNWRFRGVRDRKNIDLWYYSGEYTIDFLFDDLLNVEMAVSSWSSRGGWKENAHFLKFKKICSTGKTYLSNIWKNIMNSVYDDNNQTRNFCPFEPGHYTLRNCKADLTSTRIGVFFYGKWRADFKIVLSNWSCISCMRIFASTVPIVEHGSHFGAATTGNKDKPDKP